MNNIFHSQQCLHKTPKMFDKQTLAIRALCLIVALTATAAVAQQEQKSADEVAKELSNPAGALASLFTSLEYTQYKGDLEDAGSQEGWAFTFQPVLPFPVGDKGRNIIFRPLIPVPLNQPVFHSKQSPADRVHVASGGLTTFVKPGPGEFDTANINLGDIGFDLVLAGTEMKDKHNGVLWGVGMAGTLPTATSDDLANKQWRLGPEVFGGIVRKWGSMGVVFNHQWRVGGSNDQAHSVTGGQYFYAVGLGNGWQLASGPNFSYDWKAKSGDALTLPLGFGMAKTSKIGSIPVKFQGQVFYYVAQPDTFGPDWALKFTVTPVIQNPFVRK
ncbi:MAG: hypothetical protein OET41_12490 [Xanthomonadales bacterium]|nr:hypothetical protein [Xanthomonadales bacterium]